MMMVSIVNDILSIVYSSAAFCDILAVLAHGLI